VQYQVLVMPRALRELETAVSWWRANRLENPLLLEDEIDDVLTRLASFPDRGLALPRSQPRSRRRYLVTERTRYVVRYRIRPRALRVEVLSIRYGGRAG
jgi:plasmid stabilization system protein ParE